MASMTPRRVEMGTLMYTYMDIGFNFQKYPQTSFSSLQENT